MSMAQGFPALAVVSAHTHCAEPNAVTASEFPDLKRLYSNIKSGSTAFRICGPFPFQKAVHAAFRTLLSFRTPRERVIRPLAQLKSPIIIEPGEGGFYFDRSKRITLSSCLCPDRVTFIDCAGVTEEGLMSTADILLHELGHAEQDLLRKDLVRLKGQKVPGWTNELERDNIQQLANVVRKEMGYAGRRHLHTGHTVHRCTAAAAPAPAPKPVKAEKKAGPGKGGGPDAPVQEASDE